MKRTLKVVSDSGLKDVLKSLKGLTSNVSKSSFDNVNTMLKNANTGSSVADAIMKRMQVKLKGGIPHMNDTPLSKFLSMLRCGDLLGLYKAAKSKVIPSLADRKAFDKLVGDTPARALRKIKEAATLAKKERPHLNVTGNSLDALSTAGKKELKEIEKKLAKRFPHKKIALCVGLLTIGGTGYIAKAWLDNRGCFMFTTRDSKKSSCKVAALTCMPVQKTDMAPACLNSSIGDYYNTTLQLMHIFQYGTIVERENLIRFLNINETQFDILHLLDNRFGDVSEYFTQPQRRSRVNACQLSDVQIENGIIPPCRMCDTNVSPKSTRYIDPSLYGENIHFQCIENPNLLDVMTDIVQTTGENIWAGVSGILQIVKKVVLVASFLGVCVLLIYGFFLVSKRNPSVMIETNTPYGSMARL